MVLLLATHWPGVRIEGPVPRTDLWLHLAAFGAWTVGLASTAWPGPMFSKRGIVNASMIAAAYSVLGELSQGIPGIGRVVAWEDAAANLGGVALATLGLSIIARLLARIGLELVEAELDEVDRA